MPFLAKRSSDQLVRAGEAIVTSPPALANPKTVSKRSPRTCVGEQGAANAGSSALEVADSGAETKLCGTSASLMQDPVASLVLPPDGASALSTFSDHPRRVGSSGKAGVTRPVGRSRGRHEHSSSDPRDVFRVNAMVPLESTAAAIRASPTSASLDVVDRLRRWLRRRRRRPGPQRGWSALAGCSRVPAQKGTGRAAGGWRQAVGRSAGTAW
jgi:hypothetical protein